MQSLFESKIFVWVVVAAIGAAVVYAIYLVGSPADQRAIQFDERRVNELRQISYAILLYWDEHERLPENFEQLRGERLYIQSIADPRTGERYEYRILSETLYELCATFETDSLKTSQAYPKPFSEQQWDHGIGRECFEREVAIEAPEEPGELIPLI